MGASNDGLQQTPSKDRLPRLQRLQETGSRCLQARHEYGPELGKREASGRLIWQTFGLGLGAGGRYARRQLKCPIRKDHGQASGKLHATHIGFNL